MSAYLSVMMPSVWKGFLRAELTQQNLGRQSSQDFALSTSTIPYQMNKKCFLQATVLAFELLLGPYILKHKAYTKMIQNMVVFTIKLSESLAAREACLWDYVKQSLSREYKCKSSYYCDFFLQYQIHNPPKICKTKTPSTTKTSDMPILIYVDLSRGNFLLQVYSLFGILFTVMKCVLAYNKWQIWEQICIFCSFEEER